MLTHVTPFMCSNQARLFRLSGEMGYDTRVFFREFMNSGIAASMDGIYSRYQWMCDDYVMEDFEKEVRLVKGEAWDAGFLWWAGYFYRYWQQLDGTKSRDIYRMADFDCMAGIYIGYHTLPFEEGVPRLIEALAERGIVPSTPKP